MSPVERDIAELALFLRTMRAEGYSNIRPVEDALRRLGRVAMAPIWRPIIDAPRGQTLLVWGGAGLRFMRNDDGQWRNMMGAPKGAPTCWMPLPATPATSERAP